MPSSSPSLSAVLLLLCASAARVSASCAYGTHLHARAEGEAVEVNKFGYTGAISPLNWLSLDPAANTACSAGKTQSPIDMTEGQFSLLSAADVQLNIPDIPETEFENLGTTVEVIVPPGASMVANGTTFNMQQFHFHLPSEHLDQGRSFAMEMHMVFESEAKEIAVLGVYLDTANGAGAAAPAAEPAAEEPAPAAKPERRHARDVDAPRAKRQIQVISSGNGKPSAASQSIIDNILAAIGFGGSAGGSAGGAAGGANNVIDVGQGSGSVGAATGGSNLIDTIMKSVGAIATPGTKTKIGPLSMAGLAESIKAGQLQTYAGSLTTPPCSEGVRWFVSTQKQTISLQTFDSARSVIGFNARFPQNKLGEENVLALAAAAAAQPAAAPAAAPAPVESEAAESKPVATTAAEAKPTESKAAAAPAADATVGAK